MTILGMDEAIFSNLFHSIIKEILMSSFRRFFQKPKKTPGGSTVEEYIPNNKKPELGFSNAPADWQRLRESYYEKWFGSSEKNIIWHELVPLIPHIDIHVFPPSEESGRNYFTLITSGMSDERMSLPEGKDKQYARAEIIFYVANDKAIAHQTEKPWYVNDMFFFAHFPFKYKTWLAISHTLAMQNPPAPIITGSSLTTAFFLPPIFEPKEFVDNFKLGNEKVNLLWLTFLSNKETEYKLNKGYGELVEKFNKDNFPQVFNPLRKSII
jgi:hypothetical protein